MNTPAAKPSEKKAKVVIAGGSGLIGRALAKRLLKLGYQPVILSRNPDTNLPGIICTRWDGKTLDPGSGPPWAQHFENAAAVVNLTGKSIDCRPTKKNMEQCLQSRVDSVNVLTNAVGKCRNKPKVWIQASAVGIYGDAGETICDELFAGNPSQLRTLCQKWEESFHDLNLADTRKIIYRIGVVLSNQGGALRKLMGITKSFLGGTAGSGNQFVSWIDIRDLVELFIFGIENDRVQGTFNASSPNPVTNRKLMATLRKELHRPWCPPAPAIAVKLGALVLNTNPALALESQRCSSQKITDIGFHFQFENITDSLKEQLSTP